VYENPDCLHVLRCFALCCAAHLAQQLTTDMLVQQHHIDDICVAHGIPPATHAQAQLRRSLGLCRRLWILGLGCFYHVSSDVSLRLTVSHQQRVHRHSCWLDQHLAQLAQLAGKVQRRPAVIVMQVGVSALQDTNSSSSGGQWMITLVETC
jgi:hypothetical protein